MVQQLNGKITTDLVIPQKRPALSCSLKMTPVPVLGKFRPIVGQCCQQCTPDSLSRHRKKFGQSPLLDFHNILCVNETHTRYRGWLVRRICCVLFVSGCKVYPSPVNSRQERICESNRVREALAANPKAPEGGDSQGQLHPISSFCPIINTCISPFFLRCVGWVMMKMFASVFGSIQVNLNHFVALHRASEEGSLLVYVYVRQSILDSVLLSLALFCNNLRVPYAICPIQVNNSFLRSIFQKIGMIFLPPSAATEQDAEMDHLYRPVMTSLVRELLHEGQSLSVGVSAESGQGCQWLAHIRHLIKEGSVPDISLVPVGISYDSVPESQMQMTSVYRWLLSLLWRKSEGIVRIHLAQPFSLKEMHASGRCRVVEWRPLQDLLLPVIINNSTESEFGQRKISWLLPSRSASETAELTHQESELSMAIAVHLIFSVTSCMAVMSTSLLSSLLLYRHRKGVSTSVLCRDVSWLTEELLFRNKDVGFGGSLTEVVHYSVTLLASHLIIAAVPSRQDPLIVPRPTFAAAHHLDLQAQIVTHTFILEAVGACAVSAMLCEIASSGISSEVRADSADGDAVKGDLEFDVVLCQLELTERALQLCHLLPPGFRPPCQSSQSFALDAIDSLVRCGILIMEEVQRDNPICHFWKREGMLAWTTTDEPYQSDSECEEQDLRAYKISQPNQCPDMLFFLCNMLAGRLRALSWTTAFLDHLRTPLPEGDFVTQLCSHLCDTATEKKRYYESCSQEAAHAAVGTLIDLGVRGQRERASFQHLQSTKSRSEIYSPDAGALRSSWRSGGKEKSSWGSRLCSSRQKTGRNCSASSLASSTINMLKRAVQSLLCF
ncbi:glycerol-3-phosphate acyltransferase 2, mitochondrial isoform X1 [Hippocampus comes]|uniref:glycerol-3-phosphate acyltransferase 2, mitochondrial isoform X1 n=1 Tax=Hippocampus comes TaxID=109280 RepID=UPI00094EA1A3|nr:PREDICTED: glycerol-3-phosphate acyltransferase 2, mitochondrial-like isoform X1 [Hippocampus comes]XP_019743490.1 PREDICTED: glycerol-3-phosphate acyltransferase 2, mitochondrial-like isoform X1 [Hippocampus comes]XP_019743500.1 PREDICTED: glycerol-3-phosphate acyltransferase 2, mitochondrial-like isoform X1 [Hippocampus comes]